MSEWNAMTYEGKDTILRVVRDEAERMFAMAERPATWDAPTACEGWTTARHRRPHRRHHRGLLPGVRRGPRRPGRSARRTG